MKKEFWDSVIQGSRKRMGGEDFKKLSLMEAIVQRILVEGR